MEKMDVGEEVNTSVQFDDIMVINEPTKSNTPERLSAIFDHVGTSIYRSLPTYVPNACDKYARAFLISMVENGCDENERVFLDNMIHRHGNEEEEHAFLTHMIQKNFTIENERSFLNNMLQKSYNRDIAQPHYMEEMEQARMMNIVKKYYPRKEEQNLMISVLQKCYHRELAQKCCNSEERAFLINIVRVLMPLYYPNATITDICIAVLFAYYALEINEQVTDTLKTSMYKKFASNPRNVTKIFFDITTGDVTVDGTNISSAIRRYIMFDRPKLLEEADQTHALPNVYAGRRRKRTTRKLRKRKPKTKRRRSRKV